MKQEGPFDAKILEVIKKLPDTSWIRIAQGLEEGGCLELAPVTH